MSNVGNGLNKKFSEILGKMDNKVLQAKLNTALDMLKKGKTDELAKKINKIDKEELLEKANDFNMQKLDELNIDIEEIKSKVTCQDLETLKNIIGDHGEELVKKFKDIIK